MDTTKNNENERISVTAVTVDKGVITVIDPEGDIRMFRHPLIEQMYIDDIEKKLSNGELCENLFDYDRFPVEWEIDTEEPEITGDLATKYDM